MDIYETSRKLTKAALDDLAILAGDKGGGGGSWQDVAGTASVNLQALAGFLDTVRSGERHWRGCPLTGPVVFASPSEVLEER